VAVAALAVLAIVGGARAAPPEDNILPADQYTTDKGRTLGAKYATALRELNAGIYNCMPWLDVQRQGIGFFRPKHMTPPKDDRYLSLRIYVDQDPSAPFSALKFEERASAMFSRYVGEMLRRMTQTASILSDPAVDGFTVIVDWLKQTGGTGRPVRETIAVFTERPAAADYLAARAKIADLAARAVVFGYDGETPLGRFRLQAWEDGFVKSFQVANYQPDAGVTCRR
jgi:hypothetical protein